MKSVKIPMTIGEFHLAEFPFGWKDEYCDGFAYFTPRQHGILMKTRIENRKIDTSAEVQPLSATTFEELRGLFYAAFVDSVEFCDYTKAEIKKLAESNLKDFFGGMRGIPQPELCRAAIMPKAKRKLVGACLVSKYKYGFKNEILFVHPKFQLAGIGTALVSSVLNDLNEGGKGYFWSEYHICNESSAGWHKKFGFIEEPDIMTAKFRRGYFRHEVWRNEQLGNVRKVEKIKPLLLQAEAEVERLEKIEEKDFDAAWLRWKYDY